MLVKELVYSILDLSKAASSDDSWITEEHVIFLCNKYRAFLLKKEQERINTTEAFSAFDYQQICLDLEKVPALDGEPCTGGYYLRTTKKIPKILEDTVPRAYPIDFYQGINISYISRDKMRYVGTNPFLQNIIYVSLGPDNYLYLNSSNPQFLYLKKLRLSAVFEDVENIADLLCDDEGNNTACDPLEMQFPISDHLVPSLIELVVKEIIGAKYQKQDTANNAKDDMTDIITK